MTKEEELDRADELMRLGRVRASGRKLQALMLRYPADSAVYNDVVNIYLLGNFFEEARKTISTWGRKNPTKKLFTEFSLDEIARDEEKWKALNSRSSKTFKCPWYQRSIFNRLSEVQLMDETARFSIDSRQYEYPYEKLKAVVEKRLFRGGKLRYAAKLFIHAPDQTFSLIVSQESGVFDDAPILLRELGKHLKIRTRVIRPKSQNIILPVILVGSAIAIGRIAPPGLLRDGVSFVLVILGFLAGAIGWDREHS